MSALYGPVLSKEKLEFEMDSKKSSSCNQYLAAFTCCILSFIYGQAIGWTSSAVPQFQNGVLPSGPVSQENIGWVGGTLCLGALVTSPLPGLVADAKGRKTAAYLSALSFLISWSFMYSAQSLWYVLVARVLAGFGAAGSITVVSIYNNEIAEPRNKASLGGLMVMTYTSGILAAYMLGAWLSFSNVIIIYICLSALFFPAWWFMPESPAYLVLNGREEEARRVLRWLMGSHGMHAEDELERLRTEQAGAVKPASLKQFFRDPAARKALFLAAVMTSVQTFVGVFAVLNYANIIIGRSGGKLSDTASSLLFGCVMVVGSALPPIIADKMPRKVILGISCCFLAAGMGTLGTFQYLQTQGMDISQPGSVLGFVPIIVLSVTVFFHFIGLGSVLYVTIMELFSDETRGVAGSLLAIVIWITSFILLQFFGVAIEAFGDHVVFFCFSSVATFGLIFMCTLFPETRGKTANEIAAILTKNSHYAK